MKSRKENLCLPKAIADVIDRLEKSIEYFPVYKMPEIEECIRILKEAQQAAEKNTSRAVSKK